MMFSRIIISIQITTNSVLGITIWGQGLSFFSEQRYTTWVSWITVLIQININSAFGITVWIQRTINLDPYTHISLVNPIFPSNCEAKTHGSKMVIFLAKILEVQVHRSKILTCRDAHAHLFSSPPTTRRSVTLAKSTHAICKYVIVFLGVCVYVIQRYANCMRI